METNMKRGMRALGMALVAAALAATPTGNAAAQTRPESESLLEAIQEQRTNDVINLVTRNGKGIVNSRGYSGMTPLTVAMRQRANQFVNFLLQNGADPNLPEKSGDTALMIAARSGNLEGVSTLLLVGAAVDATNRQGETALIIAVQNHQAQAARKLLEAGASATRTDSASGLSARDYAVRDRRSSEILRLIDSIKAKPKFIAGPVIR
jgi:ankyrin repeat protein